MNKGSALGIDWALFVPVLLLVLLGLATLFSINIGLFRAQLLFFVFSLFVFFFFSQVDLKLIELYSIPIYIVSLVLLFLILIIGIESRGAIRWLDLFGLRIQFSEILKPFLIIPLTSFLASRRNSSLSVFLNVFLFSFPVVFFIFLQPDLGSALIYLIVVVLTLVTAGFPIVFFLGCAIALSLVFPLFWHFLHSYQRQRLLTFIHPSSDPLGTSYNAIQAIIAVGSGMFFGKGLGEGTQSLLRFLPERHTDFIFASLAENFGFLGSILVIGLFGLLLYRIFFLYQNCNGRFYKLFTASCFFLLLVQFFVNIGMNIGLLPIVGVTLPFLSYGGSSLLSNFILVGLLASVSRTI